MFGFYISGFFDLSIMVMTSLVISCNLFPLRDFLLISATLSIAVHILGKFLGVIYIGGWDWSLDGRF
jgi:hypothetical protein